MFKFSSIAAAVAVLPLMWFTIAPQLADYCVQDAGGNFTKSFVTSDYLGSTVAWPNSDGQLKACRAVAEFPAQ